MRLSGQFFYEKILREQKASKQKITNFFPFRSFYAQKWLSLLFFVRLVVFLLVAFLYAQNLFVKNCPDKLIYDTTSICAKFSF